MPLSLSRRELALLALLTLLWGLNWPVMKAGVTDYPALSFRSISIAGGVVLLGVVARLRGYTLRIPREHWRELFVLAMTNMVIWYVLSIYGVKLLSSGRAAILGYTMPVWTAVIAFAVYREPLSGRTWIGVAAAAAGVALLLANEIATMRGSPLGTLLMLSAALVWAFGTHGIRRRTLRVPVVVLTFWMMVIALVVCASVAWLIERGDWTRLPNAIEWSAIAYNVFLVFGVSQLLWFRLATILPPVASGLSVMLIPVLGVFSGMVLLDETPGWHDYVALGCILVAIGSVLLPQREAR